MRDLLRGIAFVVGMIGSVASPVSAQAGSRFATPQDGYLAIANIEISQKSHCKATLLDENVALTAGHCVQDARGGHWTSPGSLVFGNGRRVAINAVAVAPTFAYESLESSPLSALFDDVAVVSLDENVSVPAINLFSFDPDKDGSVFVPTESGTWEECPTRSWPGGVVFWIDCDRGPGFSGSPALRVEKDGRLNVVGVVVAQSSTGGLFAHSVVSTLSELVWIDLQEKDGS